MKKYKVQYNYMEMGVNGKVHLGIEIIESKQELNIDQDSFDIIKILSENKHIQVVSVISVEKLMDEPDITVVSNRNGDSRTAPKNTSYRDFEIALMLHKLDVASAMSFLIDRLKEIGERHDHTKQENIDMFYRDFSNTLRDGSSFTEGEFYNLHVTEERHHLLSHCPEDVNLLDILEMVVDCTVAGLARTNSVTPIMLPPEVLAKAVDNTVKMIAENTKVVESYEVCDEFSHIDTDIV